MSRSAEAYDVVVIGAGMAGLAAALTAAQHGADVLLLEKTPAIGGSTLLSAGGIAFAGTPVQTAAGVEDDATRLAADLLRSGGGFSDPALVEAYVEGQLATFHWLVDQGVQFSSLSVGSGNSVPRVHRVRTAQAIQALRTALLTFPGSDLAEQCSAQRLVRDDDRSPVRGVVLADGSLVTARGGVVLASGGFSRNRELIARFAPRLVDAVAVGGEGSTGDGLLLGCALGAGLCDMGFIKPTFGSHPEAVGARNLILHPMFKGAIIVNRHGERFVDESRSYKDLGEAGLAEGGTSFQVFDSTVMAKADPQAGPYDFAGALERGHLLRAPTLALLAERIGVDAQALVATIEAYNEVVDGRAPDRFGRTALPGGAPLVRLERPPYFAYPSVAALLSTYCGLTIDPRARVLDVFGAPIAGLYAAGEVTGGLHGANYVSGSSVGKAAIFGRIAGREAASSTTAPSP